MKKVLSLLIAVMMAVGLMTTVTFAAETTFDGAYVKTAMDGEVEESFVAVDIRNLTFTSSVELELYSGETLLATAKNTDNLAPGTYPELTARLMISGDSSSWKSEVLSNKATLVPDKMNVIVDGDELASLNVKLYNIAGNTELNVVSWADVPGVEFKTISNANELKAFRDVVNAGDSFSGKKITLTANIDLGGETWAPIGTFKGEFDGGDFTISNFHVDATENRGGFFGVTSWANIHDLTLEDITADVGTRFGALGYTFKGTSLVNVTVKDVTATTTGSEALVSGLVPYMESYSQNTFKNVTVENLVVDASNGADYIAGIACIIQRNGSEAAGTNIVDNLDVNGFKVTVTDTDGCGVGGLFTQTQTGWQNPRINNSDITGIDITATGNVDVGGFIAYPGAHTIAEDCMTEGKIDVTGVTSTDNFAGGFFGNLGWNSDLGCMGHVVTDCVADVDITTKVAPAGGFVGSATNSNNQSMYATFNNCSASGDITSTDSAPVGGFAGNADRGVYNNCSASGTVSGFGYVGGFIGYMEDVTPKYDHRYPAGTRDYLVDAATLSDCTGTPNLDGAASTTAGLIGFIAEGTDVTLNGNNYAVEPQYNPVSTPAVTENVASVTDANNEVTYYDTLQKAIDAATTTATVTLLADCAEDVTIKQVEGVNITLDGNDRTYSGTITIHGNARFTGEETLTIKNVGFETSEAGHYFIDSNSTGSVERYAHNVTVQDCTFTATDAAVNSAAAMRIRQGFNIKVEDSSATGMHSLLQAYGCAGLTVDTVTIDNCKNGISVGTSNNVLIKNATIESVGNGGYGIRADGSAASAMTIEDCKVEAAIPVLLRNATGTGYALTISGDDTNMVATGEYGCVVVSNGDVDDTVAPVAPTGTYTASITGGTYSDDETAEVEDGYIVKKNSETEYVVIEKSGLTTGTYMADPTGFTATNYYVTNNNDGTWTVYYVAPSSGSSTSSSPSYQVKLDVEGLKSSHRTAEAGDIVTLTVKDGYDISDIVVTDKNGNEVDVTYKNGKYTFKMPKGGVTVTAEDNTEGFQFEDVEDGFWAEDEIYWAYDEGLMNGTSEDTFNPGGKVTRQQVWMILARMAGYAPEDMAAAKGWAVATGVSDGSNPGAPVTRQQLVTLIWRAAGEPEGDISILADYPDAGSVSAYAQEAMAWAIENGVIGGTTQGTLNPQGTANRAQLAVILYRYVG